MKPAIKDREVKLKKQWPSAVDPNGTAAELHRTVQQFDRGSPDALAETFGDQTPKKED